MIQETLKCFVDGVTQPRSARNKTLDKKTRQLSNSNPMAAGRPRSFVSPIRLSVDVYIHPRYDCMDLINLLHKLGFSESYTEAVRYQKFPSLWLTRFWQCTEWGSYAICLLRCRLQHQDSRWSQHFHTIGGIKCDTPATNIQSSNPVPRIKETLYAGAVGTFGNVPIRTNKKPDTLGRQQITVRSLSLSPDEASWSTMTAVKLDSLWTADCSMEIVPRPSWAGFMQQVVRSWEEYEVSSVDTLPCINYDQTKPSAIYTAFLFAVDECEKNNRATCIVTLISPYFRKPQKVLPSL